MMATPCRKIGCAALVHSRYKGGYCEAHQSERTGWKRHQQKLGSNAQRGYGYQWQKLRKRILHRDEYCCVVCAKNGRLTEAREVDHIIPKAQGGTDAESNLQTLPQNKDTKRVTKHARMSEKVQVMGVFVVKTPEVWGKGGVKAWSKRPT